MNIFKKSVYLDYAAATPILPMVIGAMNKVYQKYFANPGAIHHDGVAAQSLLESNRTKVRTLLHAQDHRVVFVRGGTEACNSAVRGVISAYTGPGIPHIIMSSIEHSAVRNTVYQLAKNGDISYTEIMVDDSGRILVSDIQNSITDSTVLICVQLVNNEIGVIQPIRDIVRMVAKYRTETRQQYPYVYTDAIQGVYTNISLQSLGVDIATISGSKIYGPKSCAVMCIKKDVVVAGILYGGNQEYGIRPGTEDVAQIVGFCTALESISGLVKKYTAVYEQYQQYIVRELSIHIPGIVINTPFTKAGYASSHILNISIPGFDSEYAVLFCDANGYRVASQSACTATSGQSSYVIKELWKHSFRDSSQYAHIRISFGIQTQWSDVRGVTRTLIDLSKQQKQLQ